MGKAQQNGWNRSVKKQQGSGQKKRKTTARNRDYLCSTPGDGMHGIVVLLQGDDAAVGCLCAHICLREGEAVHGHSERH